MSLTIRALYSDPQNSRTDAEILSALRRAWLIPPEGTPMDPSSERKFSLDAPVSDEGENVVTVPISRLT